MASESKINRRSFLKAAAAAPLLATAQVSQTLNGAVATNRNILLFIADDCGVDQIQTYVDYYAGYKGNEIKTFIANNPFPETTTLKRLAAAGVTFVNAWSSPVCSPARACLYTGNHCFRHNVYQPGDKLPPTIQGEPTATIANVLKGCEYATALFGKWHLGGTLTCSNVKDSAYLTLAAQPALKNGPVFFGWDRYAGAFGGDVDSYRDWQKITDTTGTQTCVNHEKTYAPKVNRDDTIAWINAQTQTKPWMAVVAFNAPHKPWEELADDFVPPRTESGTTPNKWRCDYRSMVESIDIYIGNVLDSMSDAMIGNTTIIFMGDNGSPEEINIHYADNHNKDTIYEGGIKVPLIIADGCAYRTGATSQSSSPGRVVSPGRTNADPVNTLDLFATCAEIGGNTTIPNAHDSFSLVPYLSSAYPPALRREFAFAESKKTTAAVKTDVAVMDRNLYKLIVHNYDRAAKIGSSRELYNLNTDPWETKNLLDPSITGSAPTIIANSLAHLIDDAYPGNVYAGIR